MDKGNVGYLVTFVGVWYGQGWYRGLSDGKNRWAGPYDQTETENPVGQAGWERRAELMETS